MGDGETFRHAVPDTSGEAATRAGNAISKGRLRWRGQAAQEQAPAAPLYQVLETLGSSLEQMESVIAQAHAAIDPHVVPQWHDAMGSPSLADRVAELMAVTREAGGELRMLRLMLRALAMRLGLPPAELLRRLAALADDVPSDVPSDDGA